MRMVRFGLIALMGVFGVGATAPAFAQSNYTYSVYVDSDALNATGCSEFGAVGAEARIDISVAGGTSPQVLGTTRSICSGGNFVASGAPFDPAALGTNDGVAGSDVLEVADLQSALGSGPSPSLVFSVVARSATGIDTLLTSSGGPGGGGIALGLPTLPIPLLTWPALLLLVGLLAMIGARNARRSRIWRLMSLVFLGSSIALAANFVVDGAVGDWAGNSALATDPAGDPTSGENAIDLRAFYAALENGKVFMRIDVSNIQSEAPVISSAASTTFAVRAPGSFTVTAGGVPAPALGMACAPALPAVVTFTDNGNGTATLAGTPATGSVGSYACTITANNGTPPNATQAFSFNVVKSASSTTLTASPNPSAFGQGVTFTATVTDVSPATGPPTGTVTFFDGATNLGAGTLSGSGVATLSTSTLVVGSHPISVVYGGDVDFTSSTSSTVNQVVSGAGTSTTLVSSTNPSVFGQSVTFTASVTAMPPATGTPTGSVNFFDGATNIGSGTLNGSGVATLSTSTLSAASHAITAQYVGNASYGSSTSADVSQVVNKGATSAALTSSTNPSVYGQGVTFTATVTATAPSTGTPTGTVNFLDGATNIGTAILNGSGVATLTTSSLGVASHSITAVYVGNANYLTSASNAVNQLVNKGATSTSLVSSANPSVFGQGVTFTVTVTATSPSVGTPAGSVDFFDGAANIGTVTLNGSGVATLSTSSLTVASHSITAVYAGNVSYSTSTSNAINQVVNKGATSTALVSDANPSVSGQSVIFTATVTATMPATGTPVGSVSFFDGATNIGTVALNGSGVATLSISTLTVASHPITAVYAGNVNYLTSTSSMVDQVVSPSGSTTALASSINPSVFGQSVTFTATVTVAPPATGTPAGNVDFFDGATNIGTVVLNGSGIATLSTSSLSVGSHAITAVYAGNATFATSTSSAVTQVVDKALTGTAVLSVANPSVSGQSVAFTATVTTTAPGAGTPVGSVDFFDGATNIGTVAINGSGVATLSTSSLSVATHSITAAYSGNASFTASASAALSQVVNQGATSTALSSATNPSVFGQSVSVTATVTATAPSTGTPTGSVNFFDGATNIGTAALNGSGVATLSTSSLSVASHSITAVYVGDASFATSTSSAVSQVVNQGATGTALTSATNPSAFGQSVTFTVTVTATSPSTGTPSGSVDFFDGVASIGTVTLNGSGVATLSTSSLSVASHSITAVYAGSANYLTSTSGAVNQVVNNGATSTAVTSSLSPSLSGNAVTFTATVTVTAPATGTPAGTVNFFDGVTNIGSSSLNGSGQASTTTSALSAGTHSITATYVGNASFATSTSTAITQTVNQAPAITSATMDVFPPGVFHSFTVTTTGFPTGASMLISQTGTLPTGLAFVNNNDGTATLSGTPTGSGNFPIVITANNGIAPNATQNFTISLQSAPVFTNANATTFTVGQPGSFTVTTSASPTVTAITRAGAALPTGVSFVDNADGTATLSGTPAAGTAGPYAYTFTANNGVLPDGMQGFSLTVVQQTQSISFTSTAPAAAVVDGATYSVAATATSGLPVAFSIAAASSGICSISGTTVTFVGTGTCLINANQGGNGTFSAAAQVQQSFPVGQGAQSISFTSTAPAAAVFNGTSYTVAATATSSLTVAFAIDLSASSVCSVSGSTVSFIGVGNCVINANQAGNANYLAAPQAHQTFAVGKASQTISFTSTAPTSASVGATYTVAANATSSLAVAFTIDASASSVCSISGATVTFIGNGTCVINANQAGTANYNAATQVQQSFAVRSAQSITFTSTAPTTAAVSGATYAVTATATSGLVVAFTIDPSASAICTISGSTVSFIGNGNCVINANQPGDASFYAAPQIQQSFAVRTTQAITFTSTAPNPALFQGPTYTVTATGGASGNAVTYVIDASATSICSISGSTVSFIGTGICVINANQAGDVSYFAAPQVQQSFGVAPNASADAFTALGNVLVDSSAGTAFATTSNDLFPAGTIISTFDAASANGGAVTMTTAAGATLGQFTYNPPVGYTGSDSFSYTLSSNGQTRSATVTFTITRKVWFINNNAGACSSICDGRMSNPFTNTSTFQTANTGAALKPAANDPVFVYGGGGSYSGAIVLLNGQRLIGQGAAVSLPTLASVTAQPGQTLPTTGGTAPLLTSSGIVVTVGSGNFIHGLTLGNGTTALAGTAFGTLTINDNMAINSNGQAMNLSGGTLNAGFTSVTSTGGSSNIALVQVAGTSNFGLGALSGAAGTSWLMGSAAAVSGGTVTIIYAGSMTQSSSGQAPIVMQNRTGGSITLSGTITATAAGVRGISLLNNTGATTAFTGAMALSTTTNPAFTATGGGTVAASGAVTRTLATTTGIALNVVNTPIGAAGLTFTSVSSNGASSGIVLNNTGVAAGLSVTGAAPTPNSGGSILNSTGAGISLTTTYIPSFTYMLIQNSGGSGVQGTDVNGFSFTRGAIINSGTGLAVGSSNIAFNTTTTGTERNLSGTVSILNNTLSNAYYHGVDIFNYSGTIDNLTISNNVITSSTAQASSNGSGVRVIAFGYASAVASVTTASIGGNTISNFPNGSAIRVQGGNAAAAGPPGKLGTLSSATEVIAISANTVSGQSAANPIGLEAILATVSGRGQGNFNISGNGASGNPIANVFGTAISVNALNTGAAVTANVINNVLAPNSQFGGLGIGVGVNGANATDTPDMGIVITGNTISQTDGNGILAVARATAGTLRAKIQNNTVAAPLGGGARPGIRVDSGNSTGNTSVCVNISGNTSAGSLGVQGIGLRKQGNVSGTNVFGVNGMAATATPVVESFVSGLNPAGNGTLLLSGTNGFQNCNLP